MTIRRLSRVMKIDRYNVWVEVDGEEKFAHVRKRVLRDTGIYPGDYVWITEVISGREYAVEKVLSRRNVLKRPTVANVSKAIYVHTFKQPEGYLFYLDLFLLNAIHEHIVPFVVVNKVDLLSASELSSAKEIMEVYEKLGYPVLWVSVETGEGIDKLKDLLDHGTIVFAGMSGVGKSSILNKMYGLNLAVGEVSTKIGRGRHTTTYTKLIPVGYKTYVVDTPGFSLLEVPDDIELKDVSSGFPEISEIEYKCTYPGCLHVNEPGCAVRDAVESGDIALHRYESYLKILDVVKEREAEKKWKKRKKRR